MVAVREVDSVCVVFVAYLVILVILVGGHATSIHVRLANGNSTSGRVEVRRGETAEWGTVCDDRWDDKDATVVCRMLGFHSGKAYTNAAFGEGVGPIAIDEVGCSGDEVNLSDCNTRGWGIHNCKHSEDAGVACTRVEVRLANGNSTSGRVEVRRGESEEWGTVCDDRWDDKDATVVCRMLGFDSGKAHLEAAFGQGVGFIYMDEVGCFGNESNILECKSNKWKKHNCKHNEDAGVTCKQDEELKIRLANGNSTSGRVEVRRGETAEWGTVCDDRWDDKDATVVCRMLGFDIGKAHPKAAFGAGHGPIYIDEVGCYGDEANLIECKSNGWANHNCTHKDDAGVTCKQVEVQEELKIRLANGNSTSGRVEVRRGETEKWGTVCDDRWDDKDATVVCRMLGFNSGKAQLKAAFGGGHGPIYMDEVGCFGKESNLIECKSKGWANHNCTHEDDAGVTCNQAEVQEEIKIRLANGNSTSGRLEVRRGETEEWGTVCDERWDDKDATVVCRMLGFDTGVAHPKAAFGAGRGPIYMDEVGCFGNEANLIECKSNGWANHNCTHEDDAGVTCKQVQVQEELKIRLTNGNSTSGRVEVRRGETAEWGTVCDDYWDDKDATVVCRMLGFDIGKALPKAAFGGGDGPIYMDDVGCFGNESNLLHCKSNGWTNHNCRHTEDAGVSCKQEPQIRLANGNSTSGRVEVRRGETAEWGTVCDDRWDDKDATVVCRMLGFDKGEAHIQAVFGEGVGPILLDEVGCSGDEVKLFDCNNPGWGIHDCKHSEDAGVTCKRDEVQVNLQIRLANGNSTSGRVEVRKGEKAEWGTVCDDQWDDKDASVVCRMLGFDSGKAHTDAAFGGGDGPIYMDDVGCFGNESNLLECKSNEWTSHNCRHVEDAGVTCKQDEELKIRLANGNSTSGRVEVRRGERAEWGTVCDDRWDDKDATVVCRMLGFSSGKIVLNGVFGEGEGPIVLDEVECVGNESTLSDCASGGWTNHDCRHMEDAGVACIRHEVRPELKVRLANGNSTSGRVEIRRNPGEVWGTVCDDEWDEMDASVVCKMLGFDYGKAHVRAAFGQGKGPILLDDIRCIGDETSLLDCPSSGWSNHNCRHREDAGATCGRNAARLRLRTVKKIST